MVAVNAYNRQLQHRTHLKWQQHGMRCANVCVCLYEQTNIHISIICARCCVDDVRHTIHSVRWQRRSAPTTTTTDDDGENYNINLTAK